MTIEKVTVFISLLGLFSSLFLAQKDVNDNIKLEEKKLESTLFLKAIEVNNKQKTFENMTFLLKMGVLSPEREAAIQKFTDSIYLDKTNPFYTKSEHYGVLRFDIL